ncbi:MAG TPA: helix-turn-helix domain-containing protein [Gemmatimonadales bacterium]|nr:helix-turn-helix domain-containing protein [Gemmatimonadales bacterium]
MASEVRVPRLLTIKEVEEKTGIARWRLYELLKQGKGPPVLRIGKTFRVPADALVQWIEEQVKPQHEED